MSVRKRKWKTSQGFEREAWVVDYVDQQGTRILKTFDKKKDADAFAASSRVEIIEGTHVADSASVTVQEAGQVWIRGLELSDPPLERTSLDQYKEHLKLHIEPFLGRTKLSKLNVPTVRAFADQLRDGGRSGTMVRYVVRTLGTLLSDCQERGLIVRNPVREMRDRRRGRKRKMDSADRRGRKLEVGVDIPTPDEVKLMIAAATGKRRPLLLTAIFTGLRASELRGLRWQDVDLKNAELHVRQRADKYREIGPPKTEAGERTVPLPPTAVSVLREWKLACPKKDGKLWLAFPNGKGNVEFHVNLIQRVLWPVQIAAGVTKPVLDAQGAPQRDTDGNPIVEPKYPGLHALRHFYASWCINRKQDGGLELPPKSVQQRMGHSSIVVTMDTYGHLFPRSDDTAELAAAEAALLG
jgi:integrase